MENYEEKYKNALSQAKQAINNIPDKSLTEWLQSIFPELQESEDDRIRENAIQIIRYSMDGVDVALPLSIYKEYKRLLRNIRKEIRIANNCEYRKRTVISSSNYNLKNLLKVLWNLL